MEGSVKGARVLMGGKRWEGGFGMVEGTAVCSGYREGARGLPSQLRSLAP